MKVTLHFDGACAPSNPGDGAYGWFLRCDAHSFVKTGDADVFDAITGGTYGDGSVVLQYCRVCKKGEGELGLICDHAGKGALPGVSTNNQAEYAGLGYGLKHLTTLPNFPDGSTLTVKGDSQLIINQVNGSYQCRDEVLQRHLARIHVLIKQLAMNGFLTIHFEWIPRDLNREADALSRQAWENAHPGVTFPNK